MTPQMPPRSTARGAGQSQKSTRPKQTIPARPDAPQNEALLSCLACRLADQKRPFPDAGKQRDKRAAYQRAPTYTHGECWKGAGAMNLEGQEDHSTRYEPHCSCIQARKNPANTSPHEVHVTACCWFCSCSSSQQALLQETQHRHTTGCNALSKCGNWYAGCVTCGRLGSF